MLEVNIKKLKFPEDKDEAGIPFTKLTDTIKIDMTTKASSILDTLKELWATKFPQMVATIENPINLTLMVSGKIINWDTPLNKYKIKNGDHLVLVSKIKQKVQPPKEGNLMTPEVEPPKPSAEEMEVDLGDKDRVVPILDRVTEKDVDRHALNQLLMLGYEKKLCILALSKIGTQYGSLGYDGVNKAIGISFIF
jgi:hypothetical protein